jgi:hypothetical protein
MRHDRSLRQRRVEAKIAWNLTTKAVRTTIATEPPWQAYPLKPATSLASVLCRYLA